MRQSSRKLVVTLGIGLTLGLAALPAAADTVVQNTDGDTIVGENPDDSRIVFGQVCATTGTDGINGGTTRSISLHVDRGSNSNSGQTFGNNSVVTFALSAADTSAGISATYGTIGSLDPGQVQLPGNWVSAGDLSDPVTATVKYASTTLGAVDPDVAKMKFQASGLNNADPAGEITRLGQNVNVFATTVVNDTTAGGTADCTRPTILVVTPAAGTPQYVQGDAVNADFSCADPVSPNGAAASGVASCTAVVTSPDASTTAAAASGFALPTADLGVHTVTVTAVDGAGNVGTAVQDYEVVEASAVTYSISFQQPLDGNGVLNKAKLGRVVPVKVVVTASDDSVVTGPVYFKQWRTSCASGAMTDTVESYAAGSSSSGNTFRPADTGWIYNLDTSKLPSAAVGQCYQLDIYLGGSVDAATGIASGGEPIPGGIVKIQLTK